MVMGVLVGTATVTTQGLTGLLRHDETKSGDFYLAKPGDLHRATRGEFFMATVLEFEIRCDGTGVKRV